MSLNTLDYCLFVMWGVPLVAYLCVKVYDLWMWWNWDEWSLVLRLMEIRDEYTFLNFTMELGVVFTSIMCWPILLLWWLAEKSWAAVNQYRKDRLVRLGRLKDSSK